MERPFISAAVLAMAIFLNPVELLAEKLPKDAKPIDPNVIIKHFHGKVSEWNRGGIASWGKGGEYQGLSRNGKWYGLGKWYVTTKGTLCHETTWYALDKSEEPSAEKPFCFNHMIDSSGRIWQESTEERGDWFIMTGEKEVNGNKYASKLKQIRKSLGL